MQVQRLKNHKSPGEDCVQAKLLKKRGRGYTVDLGGDRHNIETETPRGLESGYDMSNTQEK